MSNTHQSTFGSNYELGKLAETDLVAREKLRLGGGSDKLHAIMLDLKDALQQWSDERDKQAGGKVAIGNFNCNQYPLHYSSKVELYLTIDILAGDPESRDIQLSQVGPEWLGLGNASPAQVEYVAERVFRNPFPALLHVKINGQYSGNHDRKPQLIMIGGFRQATNPHTDTAKLLYVPLKSDAPSFHLQPPLPKQGDIL